MKSRRLVCRERSIVRGDRGRVVIAQPPSRPEARRRLAAADKKSKVIIVAVMRKMITTLNAMLRDNAAWQPRSV